MLLAAAVEHGPHDDIVLGEAELAQAVSLSLEIITGYALVVSRRWSRSHLGRPQVQQVDKVVPVPLQQHGSVHHHLYSAVQYIIVKYSPVHLALRELMETKHQRPHEGFTKLFPARKS